MVGGNDTGDSRVYLRLGSSRHIHLLHEWGRDALHSTLELGLQCNSKTTHGRQCSQDPCPCGHSDTKHPIKRVSPRPLQGYRKGPSRC